MPAMADITVKKNDGTTDVVYTAKTPSSGDGVAALWQTDTGFTSFAQKPTLKVLSQDSGDRRARRVRFTFSYPQTYTDTTTGLIRIANTAPWEGTFLLPKEMPSSVSDEAVSQFANLLASTLMKSVFKTGFAPT